MQKTKVKNSTMSIEQLTPERIDELWVYLEPLLTKSCESNEVGSQDLDAGYIYCLANTDMCVIFAGFEDDIPKCIVALQFHTANGRTGADVIAMAGQKLSKFRDAYWDSILDWLRVNGCQFLDAYATERLAKHYLTRFGFTKSCAYVRMVL